MGGKFRNPNTLALINRQNIIAFIYLMCLVSCKLLACEINLY